MTSEGVVTAEWVSDSFLDLTGWSWDDVSTQDAWLTIVVEEDHHKVREAIAHALDGQDWAGDVRLRTSKGGDRTFECYNHAVRGEADSPVRMQGAAHDATHEQDLVLRIREQEEQLRLLAQQVNGIAWSTDRELVYTSALGPALETYGIRESDVVGLTVFEYFGSDEDSREALEASKRALQGETVDYEIIWQGHRYRSAVAPLRGLEGEIVGTIGVGVNLGVHPEWLRRLEGDVESAAANDGGVITFEDLTIAPGAVVAWKGSHRLHLSPTEFRLLLELARRAGEALSREELLQRVWGHGFMGGSRLVDMAVQRLRTKIEDDPRLPRLIQTVRGVGYRLGEGTTD